MIKKKPIVLGALAVVLIAIVFVLAFGFLRSKDNQSISSGEENTENDNMIENEEPPKENNEEVVSVPQDEKDTTQSDFNEMFSQDNGDGSNAEEESITDSGEKEDVGTVGNKDNANNDGEIGGNEGNNTPATDFELSEDTSNEYGPIS